MTDQVRDEFRRMLETQELPAALVDLWGRVERSLNVMGITIPRMEILVAVALRAGCFDATPAVEGKKGKGKKDIKEVVPSEGIEL